MKYRIDYDPPEGGLAPGGFPALHGSRYDSLTAAQMAIRAELGDLAPSRRWSPTYEDQDAIAIEGYYESAHEGCGSYVVLEEQAG